MSLINEYGLLNIAVSKTSATKEVDRKRHIQKKTSGIFQVIQITLIVLLLLPLCLNAFVELVHGYF